MGSFSCECNSGYSGDGTVCIEIPTTTKATTTTKYPTTVPMPEMGLLSRLMLTANTESTIIFWPWPENHNDDILGFIIQYKEEGSEEWQNTITVAPEDRYVIITGLTPGKTYIVEVLILDINECTNGEHNCYDDATCTNTMGSFSCACNRGYIGDGTTCIDVNECTDGEHNCHDDATCTNTMGSFSCACNRGYSGDGSICIDVNECTDGEHNCHDNATCTNTIGSFSCECNSGYSGDGTVCIVVCNEDEYMCANGSCIPEYWRCDQLNDCGDNSDEVGCVCDPSIEFQCANGGCIYTIDMCNGVLDCLDGSDETSSTCGYASTTLAPEIPTTTKATTTTKYPTTVPMPEMSRLSMSNVIAHTESAIIFWAWPEKHNDDILGFVIQYKEEGSEEWQNTTTVAPETRTVIITGLTPGTTYIVEVLILGFSGPCEIGYFACSGEGPCIENRYQCDSHIDCTETAADEYDCPCFIDDYFRCDNLRCIDPERICDGEDNCGDTSDETDCPTTPAATTIDPNPCDLGLFACSAMGPCIPDHFVCDEYLDCEETKK
ncbi:uncharacterized protein [Amphiura filiformis]|uniref:uncharacterized protein n=1 Tax=Amphiura filiformis TaxID=82378 RepID=UPI003B219EDC